MDQEELLGRVMALEAVMETVLTVAPQLRDALAMAVKEGSIIDVAMLISVPERALQVREDRLRAFAER